MSRGANLPDVLFVEALPLQLWPVTGSLGNGLVQSRVGPYELQDDSTTMNTLLVDFAQSCSDRRLPPSRARGWLCPLCVQLAAEVNRVYIISSGASLIHE